ANYKPVTIYNYDDARDTLFSKIDKFGDSLRCVYSGYTIYLDPNADPTTYASANDIDTEHTYPQSKGAASGNARSDMHHLFPARSQVNSSRSNNPFGDINDNETDTWYRKDTALTVIPSSKIEEYAEKDNDLDLFEVREDHKGNTARAFFYFYTMYQSEAESADPAFFGLQKDALYTWHQQDSANPAEITRTWAIAAYQEGLPNPFILDSTLVRRAFFMEGTQSPPANPVISALSSNGFTLSWSLPVGYSLADNQLIVLLQQGAAVDDDPTVAAPSGYTADSLFGDGSQVGSGSYVVYSGDGTSVTLTGLSTLNTYYFRIWNTMGDSAWSITQTSGFQTTPSENPAAPGDIIISEIMQNPTAVDDAAGEWFEVFNASANAVDLNGWTIRDDGSDLHVISHSPALILNPGAFLVLGRNGDSGLNGGVSVDYVYSGITLGNDDDEIVLLREDGTTEIDRVAYDGGTLWPDPGGASMVFAGLAEADNNDPANWTVAMQSWPGSGGDFGSPGDNGPDQALPVLLSFFEALPGDGVVHLRWETISEINSLGFTLWRQIDDLPMREIASYQQNPQLLSRGNSNAATTYQFEDHPGAFQRIRYQLLETALTGEITLLRSIEIRGEPQTLAGSFSLSAPFPNPFNGETHLMLQLDGSRARYAEVRIYDILGREVRRLFEETASPGVYRLQWDGRDSRGEGAASGTYFAILASAGRRQTVPLLLVR
ncbi:MAG: endonuclease, partial [Calditrichaeota bacterium]|nr:endonuclease [Calditrichota bacterium]